MGIDSYNNFDTDFKGIFHKISIFLVSVRIFSVDEDDDDYDDND